MHNIDLILSLAAGLTMALIFGLISQKLRMSPIIGYLIAGIVVGPYTPWIGVDTEMAAQFSELGVILLMFSVGLHFHLKDLIAVRKIALPGAIAQIGVTAVVGMVVSHAFGWTWSAGIVYGIAISVASTVVLTRVLADNKNLHTQTGHIAIGWLIVEDLFTILVLVLLPAFFTTTEASIGSIIGMTTLKLILLVLFVLVAGQIWIPKMFGAVARTGAKDLFTLAVLASAIGIAVAATTMFGASMALGAFLAGMVVGQSDFSARAASEALPMKDVFAVLFFVSVGMLLDPFAIVNEWKLVLMTLAIILIIKPLVAIAVVILLKKPLKMALSVGVALAQVGEFSFIVATLGVSLNVLPPEVNNAIITAAIISITLNPLLYKGIAPTVKWLAKKGIGVIHPDKKDKVKEITEEGCHVIIVGYGHVGRAITKIMMDKGINIIIIEMNSVTAKKINRNKFTCFKAVHGDATSREILEHAGLECASALVISTPEAPAEEILEVARNINPNVQILINTTYISEIQKLKSKGANVVFSGEGAVAQILSNYMLDEFDFDLLDPNLSPDEQNL